MYTLPITRISCQVALGLTLALVVGTSACQPDKSSSITPTPAEAEWVLVNDAITPSAAFKGGNEADGTLFYIARVKHDGGMPIGKARANARDAFIPYGGKELVFTPYEVYTGKGKWVAVSGGVFPADAIVGGQEKDNSPLYIARSNIGGGWHIGKARANAREAFIPYGGKEEIASDFQVLVR